MNRLMLAGLLLAALSSVSEAARRKSYDDFGTGSNSRSTYVDPYTRKDGTYVPGHYRTVPNGTTKDNYGTRGNYNPWKSTWGKGTSDDE